MDCERQCSRVRNVRQGKESRELPLVDCIDALITIIRWLQVSRIAFKSLASECDCEIKTFRFGWSNETDV
jgi:hypothetical protein